MDITLHTPTDTGLLIKAKRKQLGLGQADLADRIGVSRRWLSQVEGGKSGASIGLIMRTLAVLGITLVAHDESDMLKKEATAPTIQSPDIDNIIDDLSNCNPHE